MLQQFLVWIMSSGGGGILAYKAIDHFAFFDTLTPSQRRYSAILLSVAFPLAAWGAAIGMGYHPQPQTWQAAIEEAFALAGAAFGLSQIIHAKRELD